MPVKAEYVKMTTYPIDPRGQLISSRRDSALYWGNPSISSSASCDLVGWGCHCQLIGKQCEWPKWGQNMARIGQI